MARTIEYLLQVLFMISPKILTLFQFSNCSCSKPVTRTRIFDANYSMKVLLKSFTSSARFLNLLLMELHEQSQEMWIESLRWGRFIKRCHLSCVLIMVGSMRSWDKDYLNLIVLIGNRTRITDSSFNWRNFQGLHGFHFVEFLPRNHPRIYKTEDDLEDDKVSLTNHFPFALLFKSKTCSSNKSFFQINEMYFFHLSSVFSFNLKHIVMFKSCWGALKMWKWENLLHATRSHFMISILLSVNLRSC